MIELPQGSQHNVGGVLRTVSSLRQWPIGKGVADLSVAAGVLTVTFRDVHSLNVNDIFAIESAAGFSPSLASLTFVTVASVPSSTTVTLSGTWAGAWAAVQGPASAPAKNASAWGPVLPYCIDASHAKSYATQAAFDADHTGANNGHMWAYLCPRAADYDGVVRSGQLVSKR